MPARYISGAPLLTIHLMLVGIAVNMSEVLAAKAFVPTRRHGVMRQPPQLGSKTVFRYHSNASSLPHANRRHKRSKRASKR